jgi:hypothetical protein
LTEKSFYRKEKIGQKNCPKEFLTDSFSPKGFLTKSLLFTWKFISSKFYLTESFFYLKAKLILALVTNLFPKVHLTDNLTVALSNRLITYKFFLPKKVIKTKRTFDWNVISPKKRNRPKELSQRFFDRFYYRKNIIWPKIHLTESYVYLNAQHSPVRHALPSRSNHLKREIQWHLYIYS